MKWTITKPVFYKDTCDDPNDNYYSIVEYEKVTEYNGDAEDVINWLFANNLLYYGKPQNYWIDDEDENGFSIYGPLTLNKDDAKYGSISEYYFVGRNGEEEDE